VVLAFYPGDATTVCTKQFCSYRDNSDRIDQLDAEVLGISPQSVDSHEHWVKEQELNVPLLADEDLSVSKTYGVTAWLGPLARLTQLDDTPGGRYVMRAIFVIDGEGVIRYRHVSRTGSTFQTVGDLEQAVAVLA
jgi:peroxiredoxin Q/BCP